MAFRLKCIIIFATLIMIMQIVKCQVDSSSESKDDSSSEDSHESHKRRSRSLVTSVENGNSGGNGLKTFALPNLSPLSAIPGLSDPQTTVEQQILPILVSALS